MPDDVPVLDPDDERWSPLCGPFEWEARLESSRATWTGDDAEKEGLAIRDGANDEAYITSTIFAPDLRRMA